MLSTLLILFVAGLLTILLPCILPLVPIVMGTSVTGRNKLRPLMIVAGMLVSFVLFTFLLNTVLQEFVELADWIRLATYYVLFLFGVGFLTEKKSLRIVGALFGSFLFLEKGYMAVVGPAIAGAAIMLVAGAVAARIQRAGSSVQTGVRGSLGAESALSAFLIGLTLGLVWVPCAGPALAFVFTLVRERPGVEALVSLLAYGTGTAIPLLLIGYGGQTAVHSVRRITPYTGVIRMVAGAALILTAIALRFHLFERLQILLLDTTSFGDFGTRIEESVVGDRLSPRSSSSVSATPSAMQMPKITRAPEFAGLGPWHNSEPFTMESLRGKVVLVDFWTYSCINCIRTLPYVQGYQDKYKDAPFVLLGVHTPEFVFEKSEANVRDAVKRHGLTYAVAQDNDFGTWRAFANRYWPAKYLIDAEGYIRYAHFGEGAYDETDEAIASLLAEIGVTASGAVIGADVRRAESGRQSPETYLGERSWPALQNAAGEPTDDIVAYPTPEALALNKYALTGTWQLQDGERQTLISEEGEIRMRWLGGEINLVLGLAEGAGNATGEVFIDGTKVKGITVDRHDLFNLFTGSSGEHELVLKLRGKGVEGYAFTFGQGE